jgi:hypothetical protein
MCYNGEAVWQYRDQRLARNIKIISSIYAVITLANNLIIVQVHLSTIALFEPSPHKGELLLMYVSCIVTNTTITRIPRANSP